MDPRPGFRLRALVDFFDRLREAAQKAELAIIRSVGSTVVCKQVCVQHFEAAKAPPPAVGIAFFHSETCRRIGRPMYHAGLSCALAQPKAG